MSCCESPVCSKDLSPAGKVPLQHWLSELVLSELLESPVHNKDLSPAGKVPLQHWLSELVLSEQRSDY